MDIKEASLKAMGKSEGEAASQQIEGECCVIPEDSDCINDIKDVCLRVNEYITDALEKIKVMEKEVDKTQALATCMEAARLLDVYRNIRLNVELSSKIKFSIDPRSTKK